MSDQPQTTLRDVLTSAVEAHETSAEPAIQESTKPEVSESSNRDEKGRFASKQAEPEQTLVQQAQGDAPVVRARPSSWKKDYEEDWGKLDPRLQDYINQRESDYAKGVSSYKQNYEAVAPIYEAMQPFMPLLQQHNMQPNTWITNLGNAHKSLISGSPEEKLQMFARLANDYGVPLQALTGQQYDPQQSQFLSEFNSLKGQLAEMRQAQEQKEQMTLQQEIESFQKDAPHFEEVRETMAQLLQSGVANDLKSAYDKAIRLNDEVWQKQQAEAQQAKAQATAQAQVQQAAAAKAKTVSTRSNSPTVITASGNGKDRRSIIAEAMDSHDLGRV